MDGGPNFTLPFSTRSIERAVTRDWRHPTSHACQKIKPLLARLHTRSGQEEARARKLPTEGEVQDVGFGEVVPA